MKILSIETSCDETAVSLVEAEGNILKPKFKVLGNALYSQAKIHEKYGGVFPNLAKREHAKNLIPLFRLALKKAGFLKKKKSSIPDMEKIDSILEREPELLTQFKKFIPEIEKPPIDVIAVTFGPGLEPALWVGINFAKALGKIWNIPVIPINHMEGHIMSVLFNSQNQIKYPALALLISGGHTELVHIKSPLKYKRIGETLDDAVGESYDKVARMLGLPYPGGPEVGRLAIKDRLVSQKPDLKFIFPRPMIHTDDLNFSFSGLKTAVLYRIKKEGKLTPAKKRKIARAFEDAVIEVLVSKTNKALRNYKTKSLIVAGGVIANTTLRAKFQKLAEESRQLKLLVPTRELATDNSIMIAIASYQRAKKNPRSLKGGGSITARGGVELS